MFLWPSFARSQQQALVICCTPPSKPFPPLQKSPKLEYETPLEAIDKTFVSHILLRVKKDLGPITFELHRLCPTTVDKVVGFFCKCHSGLKLGVATTTIDAMFSARQLQPGASAMTTAPRTTAQLVDRLRVHLFFSPCSLVEAASKHSKKRKCVQPR